MGNPLFGWIISILGLTALALSFFFILKKGKNAKIRSRLSELIRDGNTGGPDFIRLIEKSPAKTIDSINEKLKNSYRLLINQNNVIWLNSLIAKISNIDNSDLRIKMSSLIEEVIAETPTEQLANLYSASVELSLNLGNPAKKSADLIVKTIIEGRRENIQTTWNKLSKKLDELSKKNKGNEYFELLINNEKMKVEKIISLL